MISDERSIALARRAAFLADKRDGVLLTLSLTAAYLLEISPASSSSSVRKWQRNAGDARQLR